MHAEIDVYHLIRLDGDGAACRHHLLLKSKRPDFADRSDRQDEAIAANRHRRDRVIAAYQQQALARQCPHQHGVTLAGEFSGYPEGTPFYAECGQVPVDIWVAATRFGHPWIVFGMAASEAEFWQHLAENEDAAVLGPRRPARRVHAYFIIDADYTDQG